MTNKRHLAYLCLTLTAILWGAAIPVSKFALAEINPYQILLLRYLFSLPILLPVLIWESLKHNLHPKKIPGIVGIEITALVVITLLYIGTDLSGSLEASLILNTRTVFIIVAGILLLKEKEERHEWIGVVLSILGILIISFVNPVGGGTLELSSISASFGNMLILLSNLIAAFTIIASKKFYADLPKTLVTCFSALVGSAVLLAINFFQGNLISTFTALSHPNVLLPAIFLGVGAQTIGLTLHFIGYDLIEASEAAMFRYLHPLVYIPLSVLWLGESISWIQMAGLAIVILGIIIAERRPHHQHHQVQHLHQRMH